MSVYTYIEVACDAEGCERQEDAAGPFASLSEARWQLVRDGWSWSAHEHYCPLHNRSRSATVAQLSNTVAELKA